MINNPLIKDILIYLCQKYPHKYQLSKARITKMVYLVDWKYAIDYREVPTGIEWEYNHYGPYVEDIYDCAKRHKDIFIVKPAENYYGYPKEMIEVKPKVAMPKLPERLQRTLNHIINITKDLTWKDFIRLVYSTYPIISRDRYTTLDLVALADEYKKME